MIIVVDDSLQEEPNIHRTYRVKGSTAKVSGGRY